MRTKNNKRSTDKGDKDNLSTTPSIVDDDDKSVKSLGMLADVADEASRKATDKNELLRDSSVETTVIQNNSKSGNAKGGDDEKDEENSPTHNNHSNPASNNRSILKHTRDASFSESNPPPPTRIALKRQRSAPNTNRSEPQQQRPPAMVSRNRSTGSRLSFSDKVQICSSDASSSQQQQGNSNNNNLNKPATLHNRQHSMESLKLPSFIRTCDRQFSLESIMSFRSQESNFNYSGSASGKLTPVMENRRSDTPTSVDTPNTAKMEQFYQECMGNNNSSNRNNAADNTEESNDKNDKNGCQSSRPPLKKQKFSADAEKVSYSSSKKTTTTTAATTKESPPSSGASTDAKVKPPPLQGQGLRGWLSGSGSSSQSNNSNGTHSGGSIPFPAGSSSNGFPPSFSSYNTNQGGPSAPYHPSMGGGYPSKPPFVGYNTSSSSAHPHHQQHHHGGVVRSVTTDQTPASPAQRRPSPPPNSSALKFGHPRPEVVEGQQIYSRHTLLLWGAHKSDISPINGNIQEGCDSILIHSSSSSSSSGSSKQQQPNTLQSKDDIRFTQMKCTLRNGGAALFALYQQQQKQQAHPIRVFTQSQGAGGIIGYRYDGLYSITAILDDATGKLKSDPAHCSSERICVLFERNPSTNNNCSYPNRLSLEELWAIVDPNPQQQDAAPTSSPSPPANYHPSSNVGTAKTSPYPAKPPRMTTPSISQQAPYGGGHHHYPHYPHQPSPTSPQHRPQHNYSYNGNPAAGGGNPQSHPNKGNLRRQASAEVSMIHIQYFDEPHQHHRPAPPPQAYY
mmetsp:Transcript_2023/g.2854  ORF Transcript_2023/g.2854 Transcript_2023/m.2854 type:complete len:790 (-) Transcript_2023:1559-3928(-)|eukprot:CAMPEP_0178903756 /NCGR_PEP_ID=MMETSP0786-20121207/5327_1 /TAXON_ID=186022 /ORGANISM="Thalassionema frauenfeldii, Strain CCMP 1798" /LENGTH=789 /DNA_ID=CAMNT_0020575149 /DNA_START=405 /DNA_END=2774 /DNA_ORIENTATION=+